MSEPRIEGVHSPFGADWLELRWVGEAPSRLPTHIVRGYCPCAGCQGHGAGTRFQDGVDHSLKDIEPVGNYGLRLVWGDGHGSGIYTFAYLYQLSELHRTYGASLPTRYPQLP